MDVFDTLVTITNRVLVQGRNAYSGTGQELLADPEVSMSFQEG